MKTKPIYIKLTIIVAFVLIFIGMGEIAMRIKGAHKNYGEITGKGYTSYFNMVVPSHYWINPPNAERTTTQEEFKYETNTNSYGIREKEFVKEKKDSVRIFTLGDSFCQGVGAPYDSTWPRLLEKILIDSGYSVEVMNIGVSGSDALFGYNMLHQLIFDYQPDLVISAMNSTDYNDMIFRGSFERFHDDGTTHFRKAPYWEGIYKYSLLFRVVLHDMLRVPKDMNLDHEFSQKIEWASDELARAMIMQDSLTKSTGANFLAVYHAHPNEVIKWFDNNKMPPETKCVLKVANKTDEHGIYKIRMFEDLARHINFKTQDQYCWPKDRHYKGAGYLLMAQLIFAELNTRYSYMLQRRVSNG